MKFDKKKTVLFSIKLIIAVTLAWVVIYNIEAVQLKYIIRNADVSFIIFAAALLPLNIYLQFRKWKYLAAKASESSIPDRQIWVSAFLGIAFGFITPGRIGELGKLFAISSADRLKLLSLGIIEKIYDVFPVLIFGSLSLAFLPHLFFSGSVMMRYNLIMFASVISVLTYFVAVHPGLFKTLFYYLKNTILKKSENFKRFCDGAKDLKRRDAGILFLLSVLLFTVYTTQFSLLIMSFSDIDPFHAFTGVWAAVLLKTFLPLSLGDIGVREGTAAFIFGLMEVSTEASVSAAFLLFVINILLPSAVSVFLIPFAFISKHNRSSGGN